MDNPARRLLGIYRQWASQYGIGLSDLDARNLPQRAGIERQMEAFGLLSTLHKSLTFYRSIDPEGFRVYDEAFETWVRIALNAPGNWAGATPPQVVFEPNALNHLETFATVLAFSQPSIPADSADTLRDVIAKAMSLLAEDESIGDSLRAYIYQLISEMRTALDDEAVAGSFDFATSAHRLWVALWAASGQSKGKRGAWSAAAKDLFRDAGAAALGSLPALALTAGQIVGQGA